MNLFQYTDSNKRYYTLDYFYKKKFGCKVFKVSLNAGFSCPNIDGTVGTGGCIYCSKMGSGDFAGNEKDDLIKQFNQVKEKLHKKWPKAKYIGYFQAHTNTYADVSILKEKYESILNLDHVVGLSIATRPDAITEECFNYLEELNKKTFLTIELGLQTIHSSTSTLINRCHSLSCFDECVKKLRSRNIHVVVHIINGLPWETKQMMLETAEYLNHCNIQGVKIHMLHVLKNTVLAKLYEKNPFPILTKEEYVDIVCDQLMRFNNNIVIHRITGDPDQNDLIEPQWLTKKFQVMNAIDQELVRRNTFQGFKCSILNYVRKIISENVKYNDIVVDTTIGNGHDTLFLGKIVTKGKIFGFDIQNKAIQNTTKLLKENQINNFTLFQENHRNIGNVLITYKGKISLVLFNLGFLPGFNKKITTSYQSTISAIQGALTLLNQKGIILVVVYPGHKEGLQESVEIKNFLKERHLSYQEFYNTTNKKAPYLIQIKRINQKYISKN